MRRSLLFIPGNNPGMLLNADVHGADAILLDLEDAVAPDQKDAARCLVRNAIRTLNYKGCDVIIRINPIETPYWKQDLEAVIPLAPKGILLPKSGEAQDIQTLDAYLTQLEAQYGLEEGSVEIIALIETALGVENAYAIAKSCKRIKGLFLGAEDLTADLHSIRSKEGNEIYYARTRLVAAARATGLEVYDTPFTDVNDDEGIVVDAQLAKDLGFSGKSSIAPRHISAINKVFSPSEKDVQYALDVMEAIEQGKREGKGAVSLRGKMIDAPIVNRAKQVLEMDRIIKGGR